MTDVDDVDVVDMVVVFNDADNDDDGAADTDDLIVLPVAPATEDVLVAAIAAPVVADEAFVAVAADSFLFVISGVIFAVA